MAIKHTIIEKRFGIEVQDAHVKFAQIFWSNKDKRLIATFSIFSSPTANAEGKDVVDHVEIDVSDMFPQMADRVYARLKNSVGFELSEDVLEEGQTIPDLSGFPENANKP